MTRQAQLIAVLADLIAEEGEIDPAVQRWVFGSLSRLKIAGAWFDLGGEDQWVRTNIGAKVVAEVFSDLRRWRWWATGESGHEPTQQAAMRAADLELQDSGWLLVGGVWGQDSADVVATFNDATRRFSDALASIQATIGDRVVPAPDWLEVLRRRRARGSD